MCDHSHSHSHGTCSGVHPSAATASSKQQPHHHDDDSVQHRRQLFMALGVCATFMIIEFGGGIASNSLAILSDALHMLTDVIGFVIAISATYVAAWKKDASYTYGYKRAELLGCVGSIVLTWFLTLLLAIEVVHRLSVPESVNGAVMFGIALAGVFGNLIMLYVLRGNEHLHMHHGHSHNCGGHGHSHGDTVPIADEDSNGVEGEAEAQTHLVRHDDATEFTLHHNLNMRAAMIHVLGDLLQSVAVLISSIIVWVRPSAKIIDPLCTLFFCCLVMYTTIPVTKEVVRLLMQGVPRDVIISDVHTAVSAVPGVGRIHELRVWGLTNNEMVLTAHIALGSADDGRAPTTTMAEASATVSEVKRCVEGEFKIRDVTIQIVSE
eukprot:PhM_4_TR10830/c0_g1_i1/m.9487/K14689/SLC30A2, ZNT2; solute carrier family 30 (zinc transporter), member 2